MDLYEDVKFVWNLFIHKVVFHSSTRLSMLNMFLMYDIYV
jgi:hypothetical protein